MLLSAKVPNILGAMVVFTRDSNMNNDAQPPDFTGLLYGDSHADTCIHQKYGDFYNLRQEDSYIKIDSSRFPMEVNPSDSP